MYAPFPLPSSLKTRHAAASPAFSVNLPLTKLYIQERMLNDLITITLTMRHLLHTFNTFQNSIITNRIFILRSVDIRKKFANGSQLLV